MSFSQISTFEQCPYKWQLRYIDELETIIDKRPNDALILGNALHRGMETRSVQGAVDYYRENMNIGSDLGVNEEIKLRAMVAKGLDIVPSGICETPINVIGEFKGFVDLLVPVDGKANHYDMYDYKYANAKSAGKYAESPQLSIYKHYFEDEGCGVIENMYYVLFPKVAIRQKKTETLDGFRRRLREELEKAEPVIVPVEFDPEAVEVFLAEKEQLEIAVRRGAEFPKQPSRLCDWCEYQTFCENGEMTMMLPKAERVNRAAQGRIKVWIYGDPFSGKTTFANNAPMPLILNTDGNVKFIDAPAIRIGDKLETEGRMTKKVFGWATFKDAIAELEKDSQGFETVVVDLVEGVYELCRSYMYDKRGWEHESDDSFKAWDIVRKEFLDAMRRITNLDMNVILISHEDSSRDFTRAGGNKVTALKPNIAEKIAKQLAGMVDVVGRVVVRDGAYLMTFKADETVFGGGRIKLKKKEIPLEWAEFEAVYRDELGEVAMNAVTRANQKAEKAKTVETEPATAVEEPPFEGGRTVEKAEEPAEEKPKRRVRKKRTAEQAE